MTDDEVRVALIAAALREEVLEAVLALVADYLTMGWLHD